jgi:hypothetical protein
MDYGTEYLRLFDGNGGSTLDECRHDSTCGFDTQRKGCDIQEQDILGGFGSITTQDSTLNGSAVGLILKRKIDGKRESETKVEKWNPLVQALFIPSNSCASDRVLTVRIRRSPVVLSGN